MRRALLGGLILLLFLPLQPRAAGAPIIVEQWNSTGFKDWKPTKIMAIAIVDDRETRHRFEEKLVTHLRARNFAATMSYPLVPDLLAPGSREEVLKKIDEQKIDAAITFRLVPLGEKDETAWSGEWKQQVEAAGTLRSLVEASLPLPKTDSKLYGVEVTLWGGRPAERVWAGRSGAHKLKELREGSTGFIQDVIAILRDKQRI
jgi:hypothetical protein